MECGVESGSMLNVPPVSEGAAAPPLAAAVYAPPDTDQAQFEADKRAVYKHPLFPLLALLFERCELATQSSDAQSSNAFNLDIEAFVQHQERDRKPFLANEPEIDGLMIKAIQVLRIHLLELEKVQELCKDFCNRYITCLKGKMQSENLLRSDYTQAAAVGGVLGALESNNNNNGAGTGGLLVAHSTHSESGSDSNSPVQYSLSPLLPALQPPPPQQAQPQHQPQQQQQQQQQQPSGAVNPGAAPAAPGAPGAAAGCVDQQRHHLHQQHPLLGPAGEQPTAAEDADRPYLLQQHHAAPYLAAELDPHVVHGSTPLSQIGANLCPVAGAASPAPTCTSAGGSGDDCDSDFAGRGGALRKQKRGVLPKHATSVMRSWLFQHLVHPYPTEDEKRHIAAQTSLTLLQVNNWFINARRRILQPMLDAGAPDAPLKVAAGGGGAGGARRKQPHGASSRRFWPQDIASLQPQLGPAGALSSSDEDECDSYSSDGDEGGLVIDAEPGRNGLAAPAAATAPASAPATAHYSTGSESEQP